MLREKRAAKHHEIIELKHNENCYCCADVTKQIKLKSIVLVVKLSGYNNDGKKQWTEKKSWFHYTMWTDKQTSKTKDNHFQCIWIYSIRILQLEWNSEHHRQTVHTFIRQHHTYYHPIRLLVKNYCACNYSNNLFRLDSCQY